MPVGLNKDKNLAEVVPALAVTNLLSPLVYNDLVVFQGANLSKTDLFAAKSSQRNFQDQLNTLRALVSLRFGTEAGTGSIAASSINAPQFLVNGVSLKSNNYQPWVMGTQLSTTNNATIMGLRANSLQATNLTLADVFSESVFGLQISLSDGTSTRGYIVRLKE